MIERLIADLGVVVLVGVVFLAILYLALGLVLGVEWAVRFHRGGRRRLDRWERQRELDLDVALVRWAVVHGHHWGQSPALDRLVRDAERRIHPMERVKVRQLATGQAGPYRPETWSQFVARVMAGLHRGDRYAIITGRRMGKTATLRRALDRRGCHRYAPPGA